MIISAERLAGAMTPEQYIGQMRENRALFEANLDAAAFTAAERAPFLALERPLTVLVLTEDWCGDSAANLPMVVRLARDTGGFTVRLLTRAGNEDLADQYKLADDRNHVPTYIVLDERLEEIGHLIERPAAVTQRVAAFRSAWFAANPQVGDAATAVADLPPEARERYLRDLRAFRTTLRDLERREIAAVFAQIVAGAAVGGRT